MEMTEFGEQSDHNSDTKKHVLLRRWSWRQDSVLDVLDRMKENYKRPPKRFERKFQDFIPEYGMRLPRAPAFKKTSAQRVKDISERLYSGCSVTSPHKKTSTIDGSRKKMSQSKLPFAAKDGTDDEANDDDKKDGCPVTKEELNGSKNSKRKERLFKIKKSKDKGTLFDNQKSKEKETLFDNQMSKDRETLLSYEDTDFRETRDVFSDTRDKDNQNHKMRVVIKFRQATNKGHAIKGKTNVQPFQKQNGLKKTEHCEENVLDKNLDTSFSEQNPGMTSRFKNKFTCHKTEDAKQAKRKSSSFKNCDSKHQELALIREILGQQRCERSPEVRDKSVNKIQYEVCDTRIHSDLETGACSTSLKTDSDSKNSTQIRQPEVTRQPLNRPKRSTELRLTRKEYMDLLMDQLILASKLNTIPPRRLMRSLVRLSEDM